MRPILKRRRLSEAGDINEDLSSTVQIVSATFCCGRGGEASTGGRLVSPLLQSEPDPPLPLEPRERMFPL